jgi:hypothetical protein
MWTYLDGVETLRTTYLIGGRHRQSAYLVTRPRIMIFDQIQKTFDANALIAPRRYACSFNGYSFGGALQLANPRGKSHSPPPQIHELRLRPAAVVASLSVGGAECKFSTLNYPALGLAMTGFVYM